MSYMGTGVSEGVLSPGEEQAFKVRKPYTISKQREKWTDEEHKKFLEALKLHGRAWRSIQEHIGTKTAVQIRSHAQKFFSKVVRESSSSGADYSKPIEIPPPRPKRKPMHPYPRKLVTPTNKVLQPPKNLDRSPSPDELVVDQEHGSPTSVLSAGGSCMSGSPQSDPQANCTPSDSDGEGSDPSMPSLSGVENVCQSYAASGGGENRSPLFQSALPAAKANHSMMEVDNDCSSETAPIPESPPTSLKLFGRTVVVNDAEKASPLIMEVNQGNNSLPSANHDPSDGSGDTQAAILSSSGSALDGEACEVPGGGAWNTWPFGVPPMLYVLPLQQESPSTGDGANAVPIPWYAFCGALPYPITYPTSFTAQLGPLESQTGESFEKGFINGDSQSGSNVTSVGEVSIAGKSYEDGGQSKFSDGSTNVDCRATPQSKGFLPYKRPLAEDHQLGRLDGNQDSKDQRLRLSL